MYSPRFNAISLSVALSLGSASFFSLAECDPQGFVLADNTNVNCSGTETTGSVLLGDNINLTVSAGASFNATSAINIFGSNSTITNFGAVNSVNTSIQGNDTGTNLFNFGLITSGSGSAVTLQQFSEITNNSGTISASDTGIRLFNNGVINNDVGTISANSVGITLDNSGTINNRNDATVSGQERGISLENGGVVNNDAQISSDGTGVFVWQGGGEVNNGLDGTIFGTENGVDSFTTNTTVNNEGTISADNVAVFLRGGTLNNAEGATLSGNAAVVSTDNDSIINNDGQLNGVADGVFAITGITLTNNGTGTSTALDGAGVHAQSNADIANQGQITGQWSGVYVRDTATIDNSGAIEALNGRAIAVDGSLNLNNDAGTISGTDLGVFGGSASSIMNQNAGTISGNNMGIQLSNGGLVSNQSDGMISGGNRGVSIENGGTLNNDAHITSDGTGVFVWQGGGEVNNGVNGSIFGGHDGVDTFSSNTTVNNDGHIASDNIGVRLRGGTLNNNETGTVVGGVHINDTHSTINNSGQINGVAEAIYTDVGIQLNNTETGAIIGSDGTGVNAQSNADIANQGQITGQWSGIYVRDTATIDNSGAIEALNGRAIAIDGSLNLNNDAGTISGTDYGIFAGNDSTIVNQNAGTISGDNMGIYLNNGGTINNQSGSTISGGDRGVSIENGGTLNNDAQISSDNVGVFVWQGGGEVNNGVDGTIFGTENGVDSFTTNTTVNNEGTISADNVAVFLRGGAVNNAEGATISGNAAVVSTERNSTIHNSGQLNGVADGVFTDSGITLINNETGIITATEGTGINVHASAGISNHGAVTGKWTGIYLEDGGTVLNTGDIQANTGDGILADGRVFVNNESGKISGARFGIAAYAQARVINDTDGEIKGNANESDFGDALYFVTQEVIDNFGLPEQSYDDEVINRGLISGNVTLGAGDDVFVQQGETAQTTGTIDGGQGFDTLSVDMQDGESGNIDGDQLANIEKFEKLGAGFLTYSGSADFEEVLIKQGEVSMSTGSVINLISSLGNINSGQLTVANGGILSGGGTINGTVNVLDGGIVNPGFSPGTLTIDGDFNLGIGGILQIEVQQLANGDLVFDNYIVNGGFSVLGGAVELLFDLVDTGVTSVADTLADFELSDFFTFSNDADGSIFSSFTDALITNASFFTSSESDNETSQLTFNNGELDFNDVNFSEVQGLPSQRQNTDPENINSPATWSLSLLAIVAMLRVKRGKKLSPLM